MKKKLLCCIVATVTTLAAALSLGNASGPVVGNAASIETVDEYLLENGFSHDFIAATDEYTKRSIYQQNGVFESDNTVCPMPMLDLSADWPDFTANLTVVNIPEEPSEDGYTSHKKFVFNWAWDTSNTTGDWVRVSSDSVSILWGEGYHVIPESAYFSIRGLAILYDSNIGELENPSPFEQQPPSSLNDINITAASGDSCITQYEISKGVAYKFSIPYEYTFRRYYGRYWGDYVCELRQYNGTYSIEAIQIYESSLNKYNSATGNYYRWQKSFAIDYSFDFSKSGIGISINPKQEKYLEKSTDKVAQFRLFSD